MINKIQKALEPYNGSWKERKGIWEFSNLIAERKSFLSTKKLTYSARVKIDDAARSVTFSEMLMEAGSGFSSGGDFGDSDMSSGFGFKTESYNTLKGPREGSIQEQSNLFGKKFDYKFDYREIRSKILETANANNYEFRYQILPVK